jgi:hypothetical protein
VVALLHLLVNLIHGIKKHLFDILLFKKHMVRVRLTKPPLMASKFLRLGAMEAQNMSSVAALGEPKSIPNDHLWVGSQIQRSKELLIIMLSINMHHCTT